MGFRAVNALKQHGDGNTVMIVLIGSGHVAYGLGIQRQAAQWFDGKMASIIPIQVMDARGRPIDTVRASYADYIWGLPAEQDGLYPELGVATGELPGATGRRVMSVSDPSPGKLAGFQVGDVLVTLDGITVTDGETLNRLMAQKAWGDSAVFVVRRQSKDGAAQEITVRVNLRRRIPAKPIAAGKSPRGHE
jgi:membrane-associated protease RseP (regulator of RpoE activity)